MDTTSWTQIMKLERKENKSLCLTNFKKERNKKNGEKRTVGGKEKRVQKKTPISYLLAPTADNTAGGEGGEG